MVKPIVVVVGAQYGSESKGVVVGHLALERNIDICVRTGSINAGHTVYYKGVAYKMQQIPVAWVNPHTKLVIGAGTYISPEILEREIEMINEATGQDVRTRLFIDKRCGMHLPEHHHQEQGLHERMGSTGEGVAAAIIDKMGRRFEYKRFGDMKEYIADNRLLCLDTVSMLHMAYDNGQSIMIEGTQGTLLDFHLGHYPYVTSRQTIAANWAAEAGLSPSMKYEVIMVVRAYPIRVAGNSGPFPKEISWSKLARDINARMVSKGLPVRVKEEAIAEYEDALSRRAKELGLPSASPEEWGANDRKVYGPALSTLHKTVLESLDEATLSELKKLFEFTTVTKKLRRIAELSYEELEMSAMLNRPAKIVLNFLNYKFPELWGANSWEEITSKDSDGEYAKFIKSVEDATHSSVAYVNVQPAGLIKVPSHEDN